MNGVRRYKHLGPLHDRLLELCPPDADGNVSVAVLAGHLSMSSFGLYKWIHDNKVPPRRVPELIELQETAFGEVRVAAGQLNPLFA